MKETIKDKIEELKKWIKEHPWQSGIIVFLAILKNLKIKVTILFNRI